MTALIVLGPPSAGKTSYVKAHAAEGDLVVDLDRIAAALDATDAGPHATRADTVQAAAHFLRFTAASRAVENYAADDDTTVWLVFSKWLDWYADRYIAKGVRIVLVDPGEDVCTARAEEAGRPAEVLEAIRAWYAEPPEISPAWLADTTHNEKDKKMARTKTVGLKIKATGADPRAEDYDLGEGEFLAYASTFDRDPDAYGDIVAPGAFAKTLEEWAARERPIPLFYGHRMDDPDFNIGHIVSAKEDEHGLLVHGAIDLDGPKGQQVYRLVKGRRLAELSFAYNIRDAGHVEIETDNGHKHDVFELRDLDLLEVSLVQVGANRHTTVLAAKAAAAEAAKAAGEFTDDEKDALDDAIGDLRDALAALEKIATAHSEDATPAKTSADPTGTAAPDEDTPAASTPPAVEDTQLSTAKASEAAARARLVMILAN